MKQFGIYVPEQDAAWEDSNTDSAASVEKPPGNLTVLKCAVCNETCGNDAYRINHRVKKIIITRFIAECRAKICFCEKQGQDHRQYDCSDSSWEILGCYSCGFKGIHARCGGMVRNATDLEPSFSLVLPLKVLIILKWGFASQKNVRIQFNTINFKQVLIWVSSENNEKELDLSLFWS